MSRTQQGKTVAVRFEEMVSAIRNLEQRKMFGWTCVFVNGNMLGGYYQNQMMLRLSDKDRARFLELPHTSTFNPKGDRPMKEYVNLPLETIESKNLERWFDKGMNYVAGLPPKAKKPRKAKQKSVLRTH